MIIKERSKEDIDRLFQAKYGLFRCKKFALVKVTSYKVMLSNLGWSIIGLPVVIIQWFIEVAMHILDLIPRIYIENNEETD